MASDAHLVGLIRQGRSVAFEAAYDRHHRAILSFCRHMLGSNEEAEDAVQQTFLSAYNDLMASDKPIHLRAWLFTIARNRCYSILRARREQPVGELDEAATEGLATQVQRRQDLRDLVVDLQRLPDDQRAALVLAEMDALSHDQIANVLGVPREKVKALVFQARESLIASRAARETDCSEIREQIATLTGGALRRANLRRHLRECSGCREFRQQIDRQRNQLRLVLPVVPTLALKDAVLAATVGGGAGVGAVTAGGGGGAVASSLLKGGMIKGLLGAAIAGVGTAGTLVAVHDIQLGVGSHGAGANRLVSKAPFTPAGAAGGSSATAASSSTASGAARASTYAASSSATAGQRSYVASGSAPSAGVGVRHGSPGSKLAALLAATTRIAVLNPLSGGLGDAKLAGPLAPAQVGSAPAAAAPNPADPGAATPSGGQAGGRSSHAVGGGPFLAPSAFGNGSQSAGGGTRSAGSSSPTSTSAPSTPSSTGAGTTASSPSSSGYKAPSTSSSGPTSSQSGGRSSHTVSEPSSTPQASSGSSGSGGSSGSSTSTGGSRGTSSSTTSSTATAPPATTTAPPATPTSSTTSTPTSTSSSTTTSSSSSTGSGSTGSSGGYGGGTDTGPHGR